MAKEKLVTFSPSLEFFSIRQFWHFCQYYEILTADYFSNRKMLKFDKENMEAKMLKYIIMNCS